MKIFGLKFSADRTALPCTIALFVVLTIVAMTLVRLPLPSALIVALIASAMHWFSEIWHNLGHAIVARGIGHPMIGLRFWTIFQVNVYPPDEGELPATIHVQRALGGPIASVILVLVFAALLLVPAQGSVLWWLVLFGLLENLFVFTLQAFVPLGFNDGTTLWKWVPRLLRTARA